MPALSELRESPAAIAAVEAWTWWTGELLAMVPPRFRPDPAKMPRADVKPGPVAVRVEIVRDGVGQLFAEAARLEELDADGWAELAALIEGSQVRILLESPDMFATDIVLPAAARRRLKSAVALQLSQAAPVDPASLIWATRAGDFDPDRLLVHVAMARAERVEQVQALFEANGIDPPPVCAATPGGVVELARGRRTAGVVEGRVGARSWAVAFLLIASIPFTTMIGATMLRASAESRIALLDKEAAPRLRSEAQVRRSETLRRDLRPFVARPGITATLEEVAARLPLTDHVRSAKQGNDRILQLTVETPDADAALAALKGSRLLPHIAVVDVAPAAAGRLAVTMRTSPR